MNHPESLKMTGAEALVRIFKSFGVRHIFGLPGTQLRFYDAIARDGTIKHVLVRHEQAAAHMADGYARNTGRVGVCEASPGPGSSNLVTGVAEAWSSGIPMVVLATTSRSAVSGRANFQELDLANLFRPVAKRVLSLDRAARIPEILKRAFRVAASGKPGPVVVVVPVDVQADSAQFHEQDFAVGEGEGRWPAHRVAPMAQDLAKVAELLSQAERPLIWAGGGVLASGASGALEELVSMLRIPVATTYMGKGAIAETHPLAIGPVGQIGRPSTNALVRQADLVIAVGTRFTNLDTAGWTLPAKGTRLVHVDIDPEELGRHFEVDVGIWSDARTFLTALTQACAPLALSRRAWADQAQAEVTRWRNERGPQSAPAGIADSDTVHPLQAIAALQRAMRPTDVIICDSGFNQIWGGQYFETMEPGRRYIGPRGMGVMGYSFPAAIAARLGDPTRRYVALCGDGGFMMMLHELETSVRIGAPVVVCVLNNRNLEYCTQIQQAQGGRSMSTTMLDTDFAQIARAFGCNGVRVKSVQALESALSEALKSGLTTVIDVVTPDAAMPDGMNL